MSKQEKLQEEYPDFTQSVINPVLEVAQDDISKAREKLDEMKVPTGRQYDLNRRLEANRKQKIQKDRELEHIVETSKKEQDEAVQQQQAEDEQLRAAIRESLKNENKNIYEQQMAAMRKIEEDQRLKEELTRREALKVEKLLAEEEKRKALEKQLKEEELRLEKMREVEERDRRLKEMENREEQLTMQFLEQEKLIKVQNLENERLKQEHEALLRAKEVALLKEANAELQKQTTDVKTPEPEPVTDVSESHMNDSLTSPDEPPKVCLYSRKDSSHQPEEAIITAKSILMQNGVKADEIREMDLTQDFELSQWVVEKFKKHSDSAISYPVVFIHNQLVGTIDDLKALNLEEDKLSAVLRGELALSADNSELQLGFLDLALNGTEFMLSAVTSVLFLPVTLLTWPFRKNPEETGKGENDIDIEVIASNWYWRHQRRILRFSDVGFLRIHPKYGDVRAVHNFETIESLTLVDDVNIIISYNDQSAPDYIKSTDADVSRIVELLTTRTPNQLKIERVPQ